MFTQAPPVFIVLGRFGDIIQMLPCFKAINDRTGTKPVVISSTEYGTVLDGVSYVTPKLIKAHWYMGVPAARQLAQAQYGNGCAVQWWHDPEVAKTMAETSGGPRVLQCHGHNWGVDIKKWPNYGTSMASRCGFSQAEWRRLPLVFDRRSPEREAALARQHIGGDSRPTLLVNMLGNSSPFGFLPEVERALNNKFSKSFHIINLGNIRAHRIYDLLGLYERAAGLLTTDTATLHLAPATQIPYVAFTVGGWTQSVPKGRCLLQITYNDTLRRLGEAVAVIESWKTP